MLKSFFKLPHRSVINGTQRVLAERFDMSRYDEAHGFFQAAAEAGDGYVPHEVEYEPLKEYFSKTAVLSLTDEDTGDLLSVIPFHDSPMCRSEKAFLCAVNAVVNPKYRGKGIGSEQYRASVKYSMTLGYLGVNARASITGRNLMPTRAVGSYFVGIIPYCSPLKKLGHVDNVVIYKNYGVQEKFPEDYKNIVESHNKPLPELRTGSDIPEVLKPTLQYETREVKTDEGFIRMRNVDGPDEIYHIESLIRASAENGVGFSLDEFTDQGYFNRKFFNSSNVVIAENATGQILGAAIIGPSSLSRAQKPMLAQMYCLVDPAHRRQGIGEHLLQYGHHQMRQEGYKGIISDNFINNYEMLGLLRKLKYTHFGSFPMCAYVKNIGVADSLLVYKELQ